MWLTFHTTDSSLEQNTQPHFLFDFDNIDLIVTLQWLQKEFKHLRCFHRKYILNEIKPS